MTANSIPVSVCVFLTLFLLSVVQAENLVEWGQSPGVGLDTTIVTGGANFDHDPTSTYGTSAFDSDTYYQGVNKAMKSRLFQTASTSVNARQIQNHGSGDRIRITAASSNTNAWECMVVWEQLLTSLAPGDQLDSISYHGYTAGAGAPVYAVVKTDSGWFAALITASAGGSPDLYTIADVSGVDWFQFTPLANDSAAVSNLSGSPVVVDFNQVTAVGVYSQHPASSGLGLYISYFQATSVAGTPTNSPPEFTSDPVVLAGGVTNQFYSGSLLGSAQDADGDALRFSKDGGPGWLSISTNGVLTGTPLAGDAGLNVWPVTVEDGHGGSDSAQLTIYVDSGVSTNRPNIIVIISDDAGYADFSFMDGLSGTNSIVQTPHLDALAARGVTFARAYVAANCQPTRAAIATGAYQQRIGNESVGNDLFLADEVYEGIPVEVDTIWDRMKALGYSTGAVGKWHLGQTEDSPERLGNRPQNQGIDEFYGMWHGSRDFLVSDNGVDSYNRGGANDPTHSLQPRYIREAINHSDGSQTDTIVEYSKFVDVPTAPKYITTIFGDYAEQFVEDHYDDPDPFFLYVAHPAPHKPWTDESPDFNDPSIASLPTNSYRRMVASMMITMDKEIGDLMAKLEDPNGDGNNADSITDDTLVIFLNDNGGVAGKDPNNGDENGTNNGKLTGFKGSSHDGGIRVPMILAGAGLDPAKYGSVYYRPVHGVDILPTAVGQAGGVLNPVADKIDGVNILPFLNGQLGGSPHDVLVHKWRGSFAVIKDDWKLQNSRNVDAHPQHYDLFKMTDGDLDADVAESNSLIDVAAHSNLVAELKRDLTNHEVLFDKPRYAIRSNTTETEPINLFDHHVFRPGVHPNWSGNVDIGVTPPVGTRNWIQAGTTNVKFLLNTDCFPGAVLEFPVFTSGYTAHNDYRRKTGMEFLLNKIVLSGDAGATNAVASIEGLDLLFANTLAGEAPMIQNDALGSNFTYQLQLPMILYHSMTIGGDGTAPLQISGELSQYHTNLCGLTKSGSSRLVLQGTHSYAGATVVSEGVLELDGGSLPNTSEIRVLPGAVWKGPVSLGPGKGAHLAGEVQLDLAAGEGLNVGGELDLSGGTLALSGSIAGPVHVFGSYGSLVGGFSTVTGLPPGYVLDLAYGGNQIALVQPGAHLYTNWVEVTSGLSGGNADFHSDPNNDEIENGLAFFLGAPHALSNAVSNLPIAQVDTGGFHFVFNRSDRASANPFLIRYSTNLSNWIEATNGVNGVNISIQDDHPVVGTDEVTARLPSALAPAGTMFLRFSVHEVP